MLEVWVIYICVFIMRNEIILRGVTLSVSQDVVSPMLRDRITNGFYEKDEAECIVKASEKGDRLLEIGAGIGYISSLAFKTGNFDEITSIEANPDLIPIIRNNHHLNGLDATILNGIAISGPNASESCGDFYIRSDFWASSFAPGPSGYIKKVQIPFLDVQDLIDRLKPTFLACDIEGGELQLIANLYFKGVKKVMIELHQKVIGRRGMKVVFDAMSAQNFHYDQWHSRGSVVLFSKITR